MLKRIGLSVMLLAGAMAFAAPRQADAAVRFGVTVGGPAYTYPAPAYPAYGYDPYGDYYNAPAPVYPYPAPAPVYVAPYAYYGNGGYYGNGWRDHDRHEYREHERHEFREHGRGGRR